jgi:hypothetical protein
VSDYAIIAWNRILSDATQDGKSGETENAVREIAMYSVKPIYGTDEAVDVDGINMYKVKPVY